jgi:carbonic anhydrase
MSFPQRLIDGYSAFSSERLPQEQSRFRELAERGQSPEIMVIGCCDSRVSPEVIFDARPGELFVARNIANLVPPYTPDGAQRAMSAALEFAVQALKVKHIVVLAHAQCGGIRAFAEEREPLSPGDFIGHWIKLMEPAAKQVGPRGARTFDDYLTALEQASAVKTLDNLMTFPDVRRRVETGELHLHAAYFGVATGDLWVYDAASRRFERVSGARAMATPRL